MKKGIFITFEGGEGSGKSTQVELLSNRLRDMGYKIKVTREPGGTRIGEIIRAITHNVENVDLLPITEAYLMAASRAQHVAELIYPTIQGGFIVICDRYVDSSIAYQGYGRQLGEDFIIKLNEKAVNGAKPDLTFFLDISPELGLSRRTSTTKLDRLDLEKKEFYDRVHQGYSDLAKKNPKRYIVLDGTKPINATADEIWRTVSERINQNI